MHSYVRSVFLSDSCVYRVRFNVGLSHFPSCLVYSEAGRFDFKFHVSEHEADSLEFSDRFAELRTFFSILNSCIVSAFSNAESLCANANTAAVEGHHSDFEAFAFFAEEIFSRNFYVLEYEFTLYRSADTHFHFFFAISETFHAFFEDESTHAFSAFGFIRRSEYNRNVSFAAVSVENFGAVQGVAAIFVFRSDGGAVQSIRTSVRFGKAECAEFRAFC